MNKKAAAFRRYLSERRGLVESSAEVEFIRAIDRAATVRHRLPNGSWVDAPNDATKKRASHHALTVGNVIVVASRPVRGGLEFDIKSQPSGQVSTYQFLD